MPSLLEVPDWLKHHPDLLSRDIKLFGAIKPFGSLYYTARMHGSTTPQYVVKVLDPATEEGSICERLQENLSSPNHGLPSEIIPSEPRLLVMPFSGDLGSILYTNRPQSFFLDIFYQIIEVPPSPTFCVSNAPTLTLVVRVQGVEYLHRLRIAHLDAERGWDERHIAGRVYLIEFVARYRECEIEPGAAQLPAVPLQDTRMSEVPPIGTTTFGTSTLTLDSSWTLEAMVWEN